MVFSVNTKCLYRHPTDIITSWPSLGPAWARWMHKLDFNVFMCYIYFTHHANPFMTIISKHELTYAHHWQSENLLNPPKLKFQRVVNVLRSPFCSYFPPWKWCKLMKWPGAWNGFGSAKAVWQHLSNINHGFFTDVNKLYNFDFSFAKLKHLFSIKYLPTCLAL